MSDQWTDEHIAWVAEQQAKHRDEADHLAHSDPTKETNSTNKGGLTSSNSFNSSTHVPRPMPDRAMLRGVLGDAVRLLEPSTEGDWVGIYTSLIAAVGAHLGSSVYMNIGPTKHRLVIWPLLIGNTGSGRKGEATNAALRIMQLVDGPFTQVNIVGGLSSGEGIIHHVRDTDGKDEGVDDKRMLAVEPEFASVMARSRREGSSLTQVMRDSWDGRPVLQTLTKNSPEKATNAHIVIIGHITRTEFRARVAEVDLAGGTFNRFLPVYVSQSKLLPFPPAIKEETIRQSADRIRTALTAARQHSAVTYDNPDIRELWTEFYTEFSQTNDEETRAAEFSRRAAPSCLRIAGLLAVLDGRQQIDRDDLSAAAALVRYSIQTAQHMLDGMSDDPRLDKLRRAVAEAGEEGRTRTDISNMFGRNLPSELLTELLSRLLEDDRYEAVERDTGGRPATVYRIAPTPTRSTR